MRKNRSSALRFQHLMLWIGLVALIGLVGCSSADSETEADPLQNINWQWVSVTERSTGNQTTVPNPQAYTIVFHADNTISGQADCNSFTGTYSQENGLVISLGATTMAFCGEASLDQTYLTLLGTVVAGGPDGSGGLALESAGGAERMLFQNGGAAPES